MRRLSLVMLLIFLLIGSLGCITSPPSAPTNSPTSSTSSASAISSASQSTPPVNSSVPSSWLHNSTKYFEVYYPREVLENPVFHTKLNILLLGADYTYESFSKLFHREPERAKIFLYASKDSLKNRTGDNSIWFVNYTSNEIYVSLINITRFYYAPPELLPPPIAELAAGKRLPDYLTVGLGTLAFDIPANTTVNPPETLYQVNLRNGYNESLWGSAGILVEYILQKYGGAMSWQTF
ncbi:hypothetical protein [Thermococcus peptonophilus]|uniref:hypothetical protein n=1 Tax=Thermococcus peptonophilus TaxID=53952 RepID=UPI000B0E117B